MKDKNKGLGEFKTIYGTNPDGTRNGITYNFQSYKEFDDIEPFKLKSVNVLPKGLGKDLKIPEVKWNAEPKMYQVWTEGYRATGEHGIATYHGECRAESFIDACKRILGHLDCFEVREPIEVTSETARLGMARMGLNQETVCFLWVSRCFDNEADASKSFG